MNGFVGQKVALSPRRFLLVTWSAIFAICVLLVAYFEFASAKGRLRALEVRASQNLNLARAVAAHTGRSLAYADSIARFMQQHARWMSPEALRRYTALQQLRDAGIVNLTVVGKDGVTRWSNIDPEARLDLRDRDYFAVHMSGKGPPVFLSRPLFGRLSGRWTIQLTRPTHSPDGSVDGVVVVSIDPFFFSDLYADFDLGPGGRVGVVNAEGIILARSFHGEREQSGSSLPRRSGSRVGADVSRSAIFRRFSANSSGTALERSVGDGDDVVAAWFEVPEFSVKAFVMATQAFSLREYAQDRRLLRYASAFFVLALLLLGGVVHLAVRKQLRMMAAVESARVTADRLSQAKSEFVSALSHEVRGGLTNINGFAELLASGSVDKGDVADYAGTILRAGTHLEVLVGNLLDLDKIEAQELRISPEAADVRQLVSGCIDLYRVRAQRKGISLSAAVSAAVPDRVNIDPVRSMQILNNLVSNAVKYTDVGSVIVTVDVEGTTLQLVVSDTGHGIASGYQERIFERFRQGDPNSSRARGGSGLGLHLSQALVRLMGGKIGVESAEGRGATFRVEIPLAASLTVAVDRNEAGER